MNHTLKCWPRFFKAIRRREKPFEIRSKEDREFSVGDTLTLEEFDPCKKCNGRGYFQSGKGLQFCHECGAVHGQYTGQWIMREVTFILDSDFGLRDGFVCMGLKECEPALTTQDGGSNA